MGKHKYIESPEKLIDLWKQYKNSLDKVMVPVSHVKHGVIYLEVPEPIHEEGFNVWLNDNGYLGKDSIHKYFINENGAYEEYRTSISYIKSDRFTHNYKYSAVGLHKEKLTMALLGLANKVESDNDHKLKITIDGGNDISA